MRNHFALKCHLFVIRNKTNKQTPTSGFHVAVDKNRFLFVVELYLEWRVPNILYLREISWPNILSIVSVYTGCIKTIGAVWKFVIFTSMVNRIKILVVMKE
jgi:hypothetical protein